MLFFLIFAPSKKGWVSIKATLIIVTPIEFGMTFQCFEGFGYGFMNILQVRRTEEDKIYRSFARKETDLCRMC